MVCPIRTCTLSPPAGTRPPSQVAGADHGPLRALRTRFGADFFPFGASAAAAGLAATRQTIRARRGSRRYRAGPRTGWGASVRRRVGCVLGDDPNRAGGDVQEPAGRTAGVSRVVLGPAVSPDAAAAGGVRLLSRSAAGPSSPY